MSCQGGTVAREERASAHSLGQADTAGEASWVENEKTRNAELYNAKEKQYSRKDKVHTQLYTVLSVKEDGQGSDW